MIEIFLGFLVILFLKEINNDFFIGNIIYKFIPCEYHYEESFPCYGIFDIYGMIILLILIITLSIIIGVKYIKKYKSK